MVLPMPVMRIRRNGVLPRIGARSAKQPTEAGGSGRVEEVGWLGRGFVSRFAPTPGIRLPSTAADAVGFGSRCRQREMNAESCQPVAMALPLTDMGEWGL